MSVEIAIALLAAALPVTTLILKLMGMVTPVQFVRLETKFENFQEEVRNEFHRLRKAIERNEK